MSNIPLADQGAPPAPNCPNTFILTYKFDKQNMAVSGVGAPPPRPPPPTEIL